MACRNIPSDKVYLAARCCYRSKFPCSYLIFSFPTPSSRADLVKVSQKVTPPSLIPGQLINVFRVPTYKNAKDNTFKHQVSRKK